MTGRWKDGFYRGDDTDELVEGRPSGDWIYGEGGADTLSGGGRDDDIDGGEGDDVMYGGDGDDALEAFTVECSGDDRAFGEAGDDFIDGGAGADLLDGGVGDDRVVWERRDDGDGARFRDTLIGGEGLDTLQLTMGQSGAIEFALGTAAEIRAGGAVAAIATGFERLQFNSFLAAASHSITGGALSDTMQAGSGDDTLVGLGGDDILMGYEGANVLRGGGGRDGLALELDLKADIVSGGAGYDGLGLRLDFGEDAPLVVEREGGILIARLGGEVVVEATSIEWFSATGQAGDDSLTGLSGSDQLYGNDGADTLRGAAGDDFLLDGAGKDRIFGGEGQDTLLLAEFHYGVLEVTLAGDQTVTVFINGAAKDRISGVEHIRGSVATDRLTGDDGDNVLSTGSFNTSTHDTLDGGGGVDTLDLSDLYGRLKITLGDPEFVTAKLGSGSYTLTYRNFENIIGTEGRDVITGDGGANRLDGWQGADRLTGGGGADVFAFTELRRKAEGADAITDFSRTEGDKIDLSGFVVDTFERDFTAETFIGMDAFSRTAGEVRFEAGEISRLQIDYDGNGKTDYEILFANGAEIGARDVII